MTDTATPSDYPLEPLGPDRPTWQKVVSRDVRELKSSAEALLAKLEARYGKDPWSDPGFAETLWRLVRERGLLRAFELTYARAIRIAQVEDFEGRLTGTLEALKEGTSASPRSVPISFAYYLGQAVEQAIVEKEKGELPDYETPDLILRLGADLLESSDLARWRVDEPEDGGAGHGSDATLIGRVLGRHKLTKRLGKGGFADVFEAEHLDLHAIRAIKILSHVPPSGPARAKAHEGLLREARTQVALDHPNVVRLLDAGDEDGFLYLVMDYVDGRTLAQIIHEKNAKGEHFSAVEIVDLAISAVEALKYAHSRQIVHRDIKPDNILIGKDGRVRIGDFGLSRSLAESGHRQVTRNGYLIGTPQYMAPEQVGGQGNTYDHRADLYSFGVVLYQMALGVVPFDDEDIWAILRMHREDPPLRLSDQRDDVPVALEDIILRCLRKKPEDRFADASELLGALKSCREGLVRDQAGEMEALKKGSRRGILAVALGLLVATALVILAYSGFGAPAATNAVAERGTSDPGASNASQENALPKGEDVSKPTLPETRQPEDTPFPPVREVEKALVKPDPRPEPSFRDKVAKHALTPSEAAAIGDLLDLFSARWSALRTRSFDAPRADLSRLEAARVGSAAGAGVPDEKKYLAHQFQAAREMLELAQGAIRLRLEEIKRTKEPVSLLLADGSRAAGRVESVDPDGLTLMHATSGRSRVAFSEIATGAYVSEGSPASAALALQALSGNSTAALLGILEASKTHEALVLWLPVATRLARHEIEEAARAAVAEAKPALLLGGSRPVGHPHEKRFAELAGGYLAGEAALLQVYGYLGADFDRVRRESEALGLLLKDAPDQVLAKGAGTASYPAAAEVVLARFTKGVEADPVELLTGNGWFRHGWRLLPPVKDLKERLRYWEVDSHLEISTLRAFDAERKLVMGEGYPDARTGVIFSFRFEPESASPDSSEWSYLLRTERGAETRLRGNASSIGLYRTVLEPGAKDVELRKASLPPAQDKGGWRMIALIPGGEQLHVFADGQIVMSLPAAEARIPAQMQFAAIQAKVVLKAVRVKKASTDDKNQ